MNFYNLLAERIIANGFSDQRLQDAIEKLIDNFQYKEINISDVISFDKRIKLYTYGEVSDLISSNRAKMDDFEIKDVNGRKFWIKLTEKQ